MRYHSTEKFSSSGQPALRADLWAYRPEESTVKASLFRQCVEFLARRIGGVCLLVILMSCGPLPEPKPVYFPVRIEADVPNARVEINEDWVGNTPMTYRWKMWSTSACLGRFWDSTKIKVTAPEGGIYYDQKRFYGSTGSYCDVRDKIPKHLFFDTGAPQPSREAQRNRQPDHR